MNKKSRKIVVACFLFVMAISVVNSVYGINTNGIANALGSGDGANVIEGTAQNIWATVVTIVQILAVAAVVFAGVRYMFASADTKADIKKQTVILIVGAVLVFGATIILGLVESATTQIIVNQ